MKESFTEYYKRRKKQRHKKTLFLSVALLAIVLLGIGIMLSLKPLAKHEAVTSSVKKVVAAQEKNNSPQEKNFLTFPNREDAADNNQKIEEYNSESIKQHVKFAPNGVVLPDEIYILIDKSDFSLYVNQGEKNLATYGCAIGKGIGQKKKSGDNCTPTGMFKLAEIDDASYWEHDFGDGKGSIKGAYGPWFLYLDTNDLSKGEWDGIGIHGTHDPQSIGTRASEGCIRLDNENIAALKEKYAKVGMKVFIQE